MSANPRSSPRMMTMFGFFACCACTGRATANSAARRPATIAMDILFIGSPSYCSHVVFLHLRPDWPAARLQLARRLGEPAAERPESLKRDQNLGTRVDEVVVVKAGTVGNGTEAHHGAGLEWSHEPQPCEHVFGLVADLGC